MAVEFLDTNYVATDKENTTTFFDAAFFAIALAAAGISAIAMELDDR